MAVAAYDGIGAIYDVTKKLNGKIDGNPARTMVMSAQEIKEAIGTDPSAPAPTDEDTGPGGNGEPGGEDASRGKSRGRRRRRR